MAPGTGVDPERVWAALGEIVRVLGPGNRALLDERDDFQRRIDAWHVARKGHSIDLAQYKSFLQDIGYLLPEGGDFQIETRNVDAEISTIAGPQLVVPVGNPRFAVNAVNARWGSLFNALYATDVIAQDHDEARGGDYNPVRGARVIEYVSKFLDTAAPLADASHADVTSYRLEPSDGKRRLVAEWGEGSESGLADASKLVGFKERGGGSAFGAAAQ